jgi:hypothetical protein
VLIVQCVKRGLNQNVLGLIGGEKLNEKNQRFKIVLGTSISINSAAFFIY